ncbi:MAG TPA: PIN domain-containing protein [Bryobacteraceae bacterium]|jgi:tRNA(fMet)-specific endonuclease VapC|nr:PIN domain-containing protein [Bryobacteraceae bacterium]
MGLILDSSVVIAGERKGQSAAELLADLRVAFGAEVIAFATVSVIELEHGIWRAKDAVQAERRQKFFDDLFAAVPAYPLTFDIARRAGRIDGEARRTGVVVPFQDLVIGVTAIEFDYAIATHNVRHFQMIPNLLVKQF